MKKHFIFLLAITLFQALSTFGQEEMELEDDDMDIGSLAGNVIAEVPFAVVDEIPVFPGCKKAKDNDKRRCFNTEIFKHVRKNLKYPAKVAEQGFEGKIFLTFIIDEYGNTRNIKARNKNETLKEEAIRMIKMLPQMTPGKQMGQTCRVMYSLPINITLSDEHLNATPVVSLDSVDIEPKFLNYTFLNPSKKRKRRKRPSYSAENTMKECIQRHLSNSFRYPEIAQEQKIQGRVEIELTATKEGKLLIKEVIGENQILKDEAFRIVSLLPKEIIPGEKDGKTVNTSIKFPLTFKLQ